MSDISVQVENLSKQFHIGVLHRHDTLRDALTARLKRSQAGTRGNGTEDTIWALQDISFNVKQGEVLGLIGRNGAGKSTLLKILSRITEPTSGTVRLLGRVGSLLEVGTGFHPELSGRENIYMYGAILGMRRAEIERKFDAIVDFSEVERFLDTPVKRYSSGMYVRLAFAVAAYLEPEILLVDEVLAVGDTAFQRKCLGKMEDVTKEGRTVLFVSHNMSAITALCTSAIMLQNGRLTDRGRAEDVVRTYLGEARDAAAQESNLKTKLSLRDLDRIHKSDLARLTEVSFLNAAGEPCTGYHYGDLLRVRIVFEVTRPVRVSVEAMLKGRILEKIAYFASANLHGLLVDAQPHRENVIDLVFPKLPLARGTYGMDIGITIPQIQWLDYVEIDRCLDVELSDPGNTGYSFEQSFGFGSVYLDHFWEIPDQISDTLP